jgi:hypothetical protein
MSGPAGGKRNVFCHCQSGDGGKVLVHHADSETPRLTGRPDPANGTLKPHRPCIRPHQPICNVHKGGLAGAVLTQQCVNFAGSKYEIGPAKCLHGAESLLDADELEDWGHLGQSPVG